MAFRKEEEPLRTLAAEEDTEEGHCHPLVGDRLEDKGKSPEEDNLSVVLVEAVVLVLRLVMAGEGMLAAVAMAAVLAAAAEVLALRSLHPYSLPGLSLRPPLAFETIRCSSRFRVRQNSDQHCSPFSGVYDGFCLSRFY